MKIRIRMLAVIGALPIAVLGTGAAAAQPYPPPEGPTSEAPTEAQRPAEPEAEQPAPPADDVDVLPGVIEREDEPVPAAPAEEQPAVEVQPRQVEAVPAEAAPADDAPVGGLALTGADAALFGGLAAGALASGGALVRLARRRRSASS